MRDFPSCFSENAVQISDFSSSNVNKTAQNLVTCVYQCRLKNPSCLITVSWSKSLMSQALVVGIDDSNSQFLCKAEIKWLFSKRRGQKTLQVDGSISIGIHWDLSSAKFGSGPEPLEGFYLAIVFDAQIVVLLGDMKEEACKKTNSTLIPNGSGLVSKREHLFGKKVFFTKAKLCENGPTHELVVECDALVDDPCIVIRVDGKNVMQVKQLKWKFRGNQTILVDGIQVEVYWDVYNWLFGSSSSVRSAVFMFKTCISADKFLGFGDSSMANWSSLQKVRDFESCNVGFSLILYAWKQE